MMDTNQLQTGIDTAKAVVADVKTNWPAISLGAALVARELKNFNAWLVNVLDGIRARGGLFLMLWSLLWNPPAPRPGTAFVKSEEPQNNQGKDL